MRTLIESQISDDQCDRVAFAALDVDPEEHREICNRHKILNVPFLAFYRDGFLTRTTTGLLAKEIVLQFLKELVDDPS